MALSSCLTGALFFYSLPTFCRIEDNLDSAVKISSVSCHNVYRYTYTYIQSLSPQVFQLMLPLFCIRRCLAMVPFAFFCSALWLDNVLCGPRIGEQTGFVKNLKPCCSNFGLSQTCDNFRLVSPSWRVWFPEETHLVHGRCGEVGSWLPLLLGSLPMPRNSVTPLFSPSLALLPVPRQVSSIQWSQVHPGSHLALE